MGIFRPLTIILFSVALCYGAGPFTSGDYGVKPLVGFHFDDCGGASVYSWNSTARATVTGAACVGGKFGNGMYFNTAGDVVSVVGNIIPSGSSKWTMATWIRMIPTATYFEGIFFAGTTTGGDYWWVASAASRKINILPPDNASHTFEVMLTQNPNTWEFLYIQHNGDKKVDVSLITARGERQDDTFTFGSGISLAGAGTLHIGNSHPSVTGATPCHCIMDDFQFFLGQDNFGKVWASYWDGVSKGY